MAQLSCGVRGRMMSLGPPSNRRAAVDIEWQGSGREIVRSNHRNTLATIFDRRARGSLKWSEVESMFRELGAKACERRASSVVIELNEEVETVHRPHLQPECGKGLVRRMRRFLERAGIEP